MLTTACIGPCELTHWPALYVWPFGFAVARTEPLGSFSLSCVESECLADPQIPSLHLELTFKVSFITIQLLERRIKPGTFVVNSKFQEPCWEFGKGILSGGSLESSQDSVPNIGPPFPLQLWLDIRILTQPSPPHPTPIFFFSQNVGLGCSTGAVLHQDAGAFYRCESYEDVCVPQ